MRFNDKSIRAFLPFEDELYSFEIENFHIHNTLNEITLSGDLSITNDKEGLGKARKLKRVIDAAIELLKHKDIPA